MFILACASSFLVTSILFYFLSHFVAFLPYISSLWPRESDSHTPSPLLFCREVPQWDQPFADVRADWSPQFWFAAQLWAHCPISVAFLPCGMGLCFAIDEDIFELRFWLPILRWCYRCNSVVGSLLIWYHSSAFSSSLHALFVSCLGGVSRTFVIVPHLFYIYSCVKWLSFPYSWWGLLDRRQTRGG